VHLGIADAEVAPSGQSSVEDIVGVGDAVAGPVDSEQRPRPGDELHWSYGAIPQGVEVPATVVMVGDRRYRPDAGEHWAQDPRHCVALVRDASAARVTRFDFADAGQDLPTHAARGVVLGEFVGRHAVGRQHGRRDGLAADTDSVHYRQVRAFVDRARI
jgi:hypothetical protein